MSRLGEMLTREDDMTVPQSMSEAGSRRSRKTRVPRLALVALMSAALVAAAGIGPVAAQDDAEAAAEAAQAALEGLDFGTGSASIELDGELYEFSTAVETAESILYLGACQSVFGIVVANLTLADGGDATVDMQIPPVDWDTYDDGRYSPARIEIRINQPYQSWVADSEWASVNGVDGQSQVDTFERDGTSATGTATFLEQTAFFADPVSVPVQGTFEVRCKEE
jgi:hypothetical protein